MTSRYPRNTKYLYQDSETSKPWSARDQTRLPRYMAIKLLSLLDQRYTFAAGNMPVVLFDSDVDVDPDSLRSSSCNHARAEALRTSWFLSGCTHCLPQHEIDITKTQVNIASENALKFGSAHVLPFVLKQNLTVSGGGTYIVHTEAQRKAQISRLQFTIIPLLLSSSTDANAHLHPTALILSIYIRAVNSYVLTFFVSRANGACRFISCSNQDFDKAGFWTGGYIDYLQQPCLEMRFSALMNKVGALLFARGYYGPVGIDVLEDAHGGQRVVDMNVRTPGSLPAGVLKGHFSTKRVLHVAYMLSGIRLPYSRDEFLEHFRVQFEEGRIVIIAWYEELPDGDDSVSWANLAMGGESRKELNELLARIKHITIDGRGLGAQNHKL